MTSHLLFFRASNGSHDVLVFGDTIALEFICRLCQVSSVPVDIVSTEQATGRAMQLLIDLTPYTLVRTVRQVERSDLDLLEQLQSASDERLVGVQRALLACYDVIDLTPPAEDHSLAGWIRHLRV